MAVHKLGPWWVKFNYHSAYAPHVQLIPILEFAPSTENIINWNDAAVAAQDQFDALVDAFLPLYPTTVVYDNWQVFRQLDTDAEPLLKGSGAFTAKAGTDSSPGWAKAVMSTLSALDEEGNKARLVLLDSVTDNDFSLLKPGDSSAVDDLFEVWSSSDWGWTSRAGEKINLFLQYSRTLNEKLRRAYRMQ